MAPNGLTSTSLAHSTMSPATGRWQWILIGGGQMIQRSCRKQ